MLRFYYRAIWEDRDGWQITFSFSVLAVGRRAAEVKARNLAEWYSKNVPNYFQFKELILTLTETI